MPTFPRRRARVLPCLVAAAATAFVATASHADDLSAAFSRAEEMVRGMNKSGGGGGGYYVAPQPSGPPPPTKEELEAKDLRESSDDYVDRGNKEYRHGNWAKAVAEYRKALREDPDNDEAVHNLKKAEVKLAEQRQREYEEQQRQYMVRLQQEQAERQRQLEQQIQRINELERADYNRQLERLMHEADSIKVPPPPSLHRHEVVILGMYDPPNKAEASLVGTSSPFNPAPYTKDQIFATASADAAVETARGLLDHRSTGEVTLNSPLGERLLRELNGAFIDRLTAHSNGAMVAEALIRRNVIHVQELNILGGDRSLLNQAGLQSLLADGRVKRIVVWVNPGDVVPIWSSNVMSNLQPLGQPSVEIAHAAELAARTLTGTAQGGDAKVEYRVLAGPQYDGQQMHLDSQFFQPHYIETYYKNIATYLHDHSPKL